MVLIGLSLKANLSISFMYFLAICGLSLEKKAYSVLLPTLKFVMDSSRREDPNILGNSSTVGTNA